MVSRRCPTLRIIRLNVRDVSETCELSRSRRGERITNADDLRRATTEVLTTDAIGAG